MSITELLLTAVGLAMDAFAVAACIGLSAPKAGFKTALIAGLYFGVFQAAMPLIGYLAVSVFSNSIAGLGHWIAFALLALIGGKMIVEGFNKDKPPESGSSLSFKKMLPLALATSIDALAAGVSFAFLKADILPAVLFIGVTTLALSMLGVKVGNVFGLRFKSKAEIAGGIILLLMGIKILLEGLDVI